MEIVHRLLRRRASGDFAPFWVYPSRIIMLDGPPALWPLGLRGPQRVLSRFGAARLVGYRLRPRRRTEEGRPA